MRFLCCEGHYPFTTDETSQSKIDRRLVTESPQMIAGIPCFAVHMVMLPLTIAVIYMIATTAPPTTESRAVIDVSATMTMRFRFWGKHHLCQCRSTNQPSHRQRAFRSHASTLVRQKVGEFMDCLLTDSFSPLISPPFVVDILNGYVMGLKSRHDAPLRQ